MPTQRLLFALAIATGCYEPSPPVGAPCADNKACPESLRCSFGRCVADEPCQPIEGDAAGRLIAPLLDTPPAIDGELADWPTCFITLDTATAGLVRDLGAGGRFANGRFSVAADSGHLYVAAEVSIVAPLGDQPLPDVFKNNAISVYVDGDGDFPTAKYGSDAAQIVIDHANRVQPFSTGQSFMQSDIRSVVTVGASTFFIELAVTPRTFGLTAFGRPLGFDIGLVGGDGATMTSELVWYQACSSPACECEPPEPSAPWCDAREFGTVTVGR